MAIGKLHVLIGSMVLIAVCVSPFLVAEIAQKKACGAAAELSRKSEDLTAKYEEGARRVRWLAEDRNTYTDKRIILGASATLTDADFEDLTNKYGDLSHLSIFAGQRLDVVSQGLTELTTKVWAAADGSDLLAMYEAQADAAKAELDASESLGGYDRLKMLLSPVRRVYLSPSCQ